MKKVKQRNTLICVLIILFGCSNSDSVSVQIDCSNFKHFSASEIQRALELSDQNYFYCIIEELDNEKLNDCDFAEKVFLISDHLNFMFCGIDCQDSVWVNLSKDSRQETRDIIFLGLKEYRNSSLFMTKIDPSMCANFDIYQFCNNQILISEEVREEFRLELENIYENCK